MTMQQTLETTFDGKVFRPVGKVDLEPCRRVEIIVITNQATEEKLKSFLCTARSLKLQGTSDWSERINQVID